MNLLTLFALVWVLGSLSLLAVGGGNTVLPELHVQSVGTHKWLTDGEFAGIFAIAQAAPGPSTALMAAFSVLFPSPTLQAPLLASTARMSFVAVVLPQLPVTAMKVVRPSAGRLRRAAWSRTRSAKFAPAAVTLRRRRRQALVLKEAAGIAR
jgi:hypothetical protein